MARTDDIDEDDDNPAADAAAADAAATKIAGEGKDKKEEEGQKMTVAEDGTVTFGADARGEKTAKVGDDEDEDEHDASLSDPEREALRAKRREEKKRRREAARKREDDLRGENASLKSTVNNLASRLQQVEQRTSSIDVARLDEELQGAAYAKQQWQAAFEDAVAKADGVRAREAMERVNAAQKEGERLYGMREAFMKAQTASAQPRRGIDPDVQARVNAWTKDKSWYDPSKKNRDTRIALAIDQEVAEDGYSPNTDEFWTELDNRLRDVLPHRYEADGDDDDAPPVTKRAAPQRRVAATGGGNTSGAAGTTVVRMSPERVQAIKDAGQWNDPVKREAAIRNYIKYDKEHK